MGGSVFASLVAEEDVDFLLDPVLVVGQVSLRVLLVNQARKVAQLIDEVKQLKIELLEIVLTYMRNSVLFSGSLIHRF